MKWKMSVGRRGSKGKVAEIGKDAFQVCEGVWAYQETPVITIRMVHVCGNRVKNECVWESVWDEQKVIYCGAKMCVFTEGVIVTKSSRQK